MEILDIGPGRGDHVVVGKVVKAHGIKGEIKVFAYSGHPDDFKSYEEILLCSASEKGKALQDDPAAGQAHRISQSRSQEKVVIVKLDGVSTRTEAEALRGFEVLISKSELPALDPDQYYWHDIKGLAVATDNGQEIGHVTALMATAAHDILIVTGRGREYLIPATTEFVADINQEAGVMKIIPPPGLLEMNE